MLLSISSFANALNLVPDSLDIVKNPNEGNKLFASATADFQGQLIKVNFGVGESLCKDGKAKLTRNDLPVTHVYLGDDFDINKMSIATRTKKVVNEEGKEVVVEYQVLETNAKMALCNASESKNVVEKVKW